MIVLKAITKKYLKNFIYFYHRLRYRIFIVMLLNILSGVMDGLGLTMFLPLFEIAAKSDSTIKAGTASRVITFFSMFHLSFTLLNILIFMVVFFILKGIFTYLRSIYDTKVAKFFIISTREDQLNGFSNLKYEYFINGDIGRFQNLLSLDVNNLLQAFRSYINMLQYVIMIMVYMGFAFIVNPQFCILIIVGGLLFNFLYKRIYKLTKDSSRKMSKEGNSYLGMLVQLVGNFKYLKATGFVSNYTIKVKENIHRIEDINYKLGKLNALTAAIREPILILIVSVVILLQVYIMHGSLDTIIVSLLFFYRALTNVIFLQMAYNTFITHTGSMENIAKFSQELHDNKEINGTSKFMQFTQSLKLSNLNFAYDHKPILKDISLTIYRNSTIAFVGESGSGKTTLVNILAGLLAVEENQYFIDNKPINHIDLVSFQERIGYIVQEPVIFNDTIFNNITLWSQPTPENINRFIEVLRQTSLANFINGLELKEHTLLGNNGINLSGGQKQRISIARELFKDIDILILDEATSALDSETERFIQENIDALKGQYTILIVAHRLATIKNVDKVVLINHGQIVAMDAFDKLKETSSIFKSMVELQKV